MTAKHLDGLKTSTILREAAIVLRTYDRPTAETYAEQLERRAALIETAAGVLKETKRGEIEAVATEVIAELLRAIGELRR